MFSNTAALWVQRSDIYLIIFDVSPHWQRRSYPAAPWKETWVRYFDSKHKFIISLRAPLLSAAEMIDSGVIYAVQSSLGGGWEESIRAFSEAVTRSWADKDLNLQLAEVTMSETGFDLHRGHPWQECTQAWELYEAFTKHGSKWKK